jgi:hypothetical protein
MEIRVFEYMGQKVIESNFCNLKIILDANFTNINLFKSNFTL